MSYDSNTNTISMGTSSSMTADTGAWAVHTYVKMIENNEATDDIKSDWKILEEWLGCAGRKLTNNDNEKIGNAWQAWMGVGLAPSFELQEAFDKKSAEISGEFIKLHKPPAQIMDVFDRMLATKESIAAKRKYDIESEKEKFATVFSQLKVKQPFFKRIFTDDCKQARFFAWYVVAVWMLWVYADAGTLENIIRAFIPIFGMAAGIFFGIAYAFTYAQPSINKFKRNANKETRTAASINLLWVIGVASWSLIFRSSSEFDEAAYVALFILPSIFIWVALSLLRWIREKH